MDWTDEAIVLRTRRHGEANAIVSLLTPAHGHHAGLVRGGAGSRQRATLQPGNRIKVHWRARLAEHLGTMTCEPVRASGAAIMRSSEKLTALNAACALAVAALPEREPHPACFAAFDALVMALEGDAWHAPLLRWELSVLAELGYGLDLKACAVTGETENLRFVSPRTGRAVSAEAGAPYADRLMPLPPFLLADTASAAVTRADMAAALRLTGRFLERHVFNLLDRPLPEARKRLSERFEEAP